MNILKIICLTTIALNPLVSNAKKELVIWDSAENAPVVGASAISSNGIIIGITNANGVITVKPKEFPIYIRSLGYKPLSVTAFTDTIIMTPASYILSEVVVTPKDRPITRVLTYAREYCTGATPTDTMQMYSEYMLEYFFADNKIKGYDKSDANPNIKQAKGYGRMANSSGVDSIIRPNYSNGITPLSFLSNIAFVPYEERTETDALLNGQMIDTIPGKFYPKFILRKTNNLFTIDCDVLSDHKEHKFSPWFFKVMGMTMEMQLAKWQLAYNINKTGKYNLYDFIYGTYNLYVIGKGKQLRKLIGMKDAIGIDCYIEQYPVEIENLTLEEYRDLKRDKNRHVEFVVPANVQPLVPSIQQLIDRIDSSIP